MKTTKTSYAAYGGYDHVAAHLTAERYHIAWATAFAFSRGTVRIEYWITYELTREPGHVLVVGYPNGGVDLLTTMFGPEDDLSMVLRRVGVEVA